MSISCQADEWYTSGSEINKMQWIKNWFSNMLEMDTPLVYQEIAYLTVETFYQAMHTTDLEERRKISTMNSYKAKKYIRTIPNRSDWDSIKLDVMLFALKHKFAPGTSWRSKLDATTEPIVEVNNWHDNYWGSCICAKCGDKGLNHLGNLLTKIRDNT